MSTPKQIDYPGANNYSQFSYDGRGRNVKIVETVSGSMTSTKQFVWSGSMKSEERDAGGALNSKLLALGKTIASTKYFYAVDHLGSVREMLDNSSIVQAEYAYTPYGEKIPHSENLISDFGYASMYFHTRSSLNLTQYRAYRASLGRWISRDPVQEQGGINLFGYCGNISSMLTDPLGLVCECCHTCVCFVNCLVDLWSDSNCDPVALGNKMGGSRNTTLTLAENHGFRGELVSGGQGGAVSRHILGVAGFRLSYKNFLADGQKILDVLELFTNDEKYKTGESLAEIADNNAADQVADALNDAFSKCKADKQKAKEDLRNALMKILCEDDKKK